MTNYELYKKMNSKIFKSFIKILCMEFVGLTGLFIFINFIFSLLNL